MFSALLRALSMGAWIGWYTFVGAVLFVVSDSMIAWNKFATEIKNERVLVMSTYILAQFLIVQGFF